jgi:hypothetical protein
MAQCPGERCHSDLVHLAFLGPEEEHVALLVDPHAFSSLKRWDDLFDEGVSAVFDLASGEAKLLALSFHAGKFTSAKAAMWLAERVMKPLLFFPTSGRLTDAALNTRLAAPIESVAVSWEQIERTLSGEFQDGLAGVFQGPLDDIIDGLGFDPVGMDEPAVRATQTGHQALGRDD